jgi:hypothetical protein
LILSALDSVRRPFRVIVGDAKEGADPMFWMAAQILEVPRLQFKARWKDFHKGAGNKRNTLMLDWLKRLRDKGEPCFVVVAWDGSSRGTLNMMDQARVAKFDVWQISDFKGGA